MDPVDLISNWLAARLGLSGTSLLVTLMAISMVSQFVGKKIPDDATGWKGHARDALKAIGLYTSNRVTKGVTVNDISKAVVNSVPPQVIEKAAESVSYTSGEFPNAR